MKAIVEIILKICDKKNCQEGCLIDPVGEKLAEKVTQTVKKVDVKI